MNENIKHEVKWSINLAGILALISFLLFLFKPHLFKPPEPVQPTPIPSEHHTTFNPFSPPSTYIEVVYRDTSGRHDTLLLKIPSYKGKVESIKIPPQYKVKTITYEPPFSFAFVPTVGVGVYNEPPFYVRGGIEIIKKGRWHVGGFISLLPSPWGRKYNPPLEVGISLSYNFVWNFMGTIDVGLYPHKYKIGISINIKLK